MRSAKLILLLTVLAGSAFAADFKERLAQGNDLLRKGDAAGAIKIFEGLQGEEPNAPDLLFSLGCAQYQQAIEGKDTKPEEAAKQLEAARESFEKAETLSSGRLTADAGYNRTNALAQIAKRQEDQKDPKAAQDAYGRSIQAYEQFLNRHPEHQKAQHNLDHMRYMLKRMQQNPPPPKQSGDNKDQQDKGDQQQQQNQDGQGQQDQQQQGKQGSDQNQQDQQQDQPSEPNQTPQPEPSKDSQDKSSQQDSQQQTVQGQQKAMLNPEQKDRQTVKSLLDSLENVDQEEQKRLREEPHDRTIQEEWW